MAENQHRDIGKRPFTKSYFAFMIVLCLTPVIGRTTDDDIRVVQRDASGVTVEYRPVHLPPEPVIAGTSTYQRYIVKGGYLLDTAAPGSPEVVLRRTLLQLRGARNNTTEILASDFEDVPGILLAPLPGEREGEAGPLEEFRAEPGAYARDEFLPGKLASLENPGETRGVFLGNLVIAPIQYNPARRVLRLYHRIVVRVNFGSTEPSKLAAQASTERTPSLTSPVMNASRSAGIRNSVLSAGAWMRFTVDNAGMYRISGQTLLDAGVPASTDPYTVRIFNNGGRELPLDPLAPQVDDLRELAVTVTDRGTGHQLDPSDEIIFYGKGTQGWNYNPALKSFSHYINRFGSVNTYWLTYGGVPARQMSVASLPAQAADIHPLTVGGKVFREDEKNNILSSGLRWMGQQFNSGEQITYVHPLPGLDHTQPVLYRIDVGAKSSGTSFFNVSDHGAQVVTGLYLGSSLVGSYYDSQLKENSGQWSLTPPFTDNQSQLRFSYSSSVSDGVGYLGWFEIFYRRYLHAEGDLFTFHTQDTTAVAEYAVGGFSGAPVAVYDVTTYDSVVVLPTTRVSSDSCIVPIALQGGGVREILAVGPAGMQTITSLSRVANQNLHGDTSVVDYIIVTPASLSQAAGRLKEFRKRPGDHTLRTRVATTEQIYNEFSCGMLTPAAIRNYLRYCYTNSSSPPRYVLLLGDGHFDFRGILTQDPEMVPPWETEESFAPLDTYTSDDDFVIFDGGGRVGMGVGRLTARNPQEANAMVDKIIEYESDGSRDSWKLRATFVADDGLAGPGEDNRFTHVDHAETVARKLPPLFEKRKIYLFEYPTIFAAGGRRKPAVNEAIVDQINQGTVLLNYSGHGNPRLWAHEYVFVRETDFPLLHNKGRYFFLVAATCNFSLFDAINDQSGGEMLVASSGAGAIGALSATRVVFQFQNLQFNDTFISQLFSVDGTGQVVDQRLGDVMYATKQVWTRPNDKKYFLLGDPAMVLAFPRLRASIDSINQQPSAQISQLRALGRASFDVTVVDSASPGFSGQAQLVVYDADRTVRINDPIDGIYDYKTGGNVLFRGQQTIASGRMHASFVVPKDISYGNDFGKATVYFWNGSTDGAGYSTNFRVGGTDSTAPADTKGPTIRLYLGGRGFRPGDLVSDAPLLLADLSDSNGINTSGAGIGHRLEAWLDGQPESIDLTDYYRSKPDTYQEGSVEYPMRTLPAGTHRLRMRAWDTYNNSSIEETVFDIGSSNGLAISNVFNYPNPFSGPTVFTFTHNQVGPIDAEVKIYTVAGRLIQSIRQPSNTGQFIRIPWDGRDRDGDQLANGVYLYKVVAKTSDGRFTSEALGKMSILK